MREWRPRFPSFVRCAGITRLNPTLKVVLPFPLRYDELTDSVFYHAGMQQPSLQANARPDEAPTPIACPICLDHAVIQMDGVRLSVTINGVVSPIHAVSAYQCGNWHVFTILLPVVSETSDRIPNEVAPL